MGIMVLVLHTPLASFCYSRKPDRRVDLGSGFGQHPGKTYYDPLINISTEPFNDVMKGELIQSPYSRPRHQFHATLPSKPQLRFVLPNDTPPDFKYM